MAKNFTPLFVGAFLLFAGSASAGIIDAKVDGNVFTARIELPEDLKADLSLTFEEVAGLNQAALGLSVRRISPTDPAILARLPAGTFSIPKAFPVILTVAPPVNGGLAFRGLARLRLHTHNLEYTPTTALRLFAARPGGPFRDVTAEMSSGSYRTGGAVPDFAGEYLILEDLRALLFQVDGLLDSVDQVLAENVPVIDPSIILLLQQSLADVHSKIALGDLLAAAVEVANFVLAIESYDGDGIPDQWIAAVPEKANSAGDLRAVAGALAFALSQAESASP